MLQSRALRSPLDLRAHRSPLELLCRSAAAPRAWTVHPTSLDCARWSPLGHGERRTLMLSQRPPPCYRLQRPRRCTRCCCLCSACSCHAACPEGQWPPAGGRNGFRTVTCRAHSYAVSTDRVPCSRFFFAIAEVAPRVDAACAHDAESDRPAAGKMLRRAEQPAREHERLTRAGSRSVACVLREYEARAHILMADQLRNGRRRRATITRRAEHRPQPPQQIWTVCA